MNYLYITFYFFKIFSEIILNVLFEGRKTFRFVSLEIISLSYFRGESFNLLSSVSSSLTNKFVTVWFPRGWLLGGSVELVVE